MGDELAIGHLALSRMPGMPAIGNHASEQRVRSLLWTTDPPSRGRLNRDGYRILHFPRLRREVAALRPHGSARTSLRNPAAGLMAVYEQRARVAVLDVSCGTVEDLQLVYGYVVEPAFRAGCTLLVGAGQSLDDLDRQALEEPPWGCAWTLERLRHLAALYSTPATITVQRPDSRWRRVWNRVSRRCDTGVRRIERLDPEQNAAVAAGDGVVQVIAPAGSGKTTVLVERVRELRRRGTPAERILCSTFNRDACREIAARLDKAGIPRIAVRSFHGLGLSILRGEGRLRGGPGTVADMVWRGLADAASAAEPGGARLDLAAAQNVVSLYKLKLMIGPQEAWARAVSSPVGSRARVAARLYALYEEHLSRSGRMDFDDLIYGAIRLLQDDALVRERWQARYERVLVDEYQDIEPAQALLIGLLAAPHDSLFCVGDEDQCIYAWRRAAVQRVIELDQTYPGLERYPLVRNYRCGRDITHASRRLIRHNRQRFRKPLHAGVRERGCIQAWPQPDAQTGAAFTARLLSAAAESEAGGSVAVLARTGRLLEAVAAAGGEPLAAQVAAGRVEPATVHGSKGREWDHVVLVGADQGQFPLARTLRADAGDGGGLEDERRLFYVALTRAKRRLDVVCTKGRASQFLREAGIRSK